MLGSGWELGHGVEVRLGVVGLFKLQHLGTSVLAKALVRGKANSDIAGHT